MPGFLSSAADASSEGGWADAEGKGLAEYNGANIIDGPEITMPDTTYDPLLWMSNTKYKQ